MSRTCATISPAARVEATGDPGTSCSDRPARVAQAAVEGGEPGNRSAEVLGGQGGDVNY